MKEGTFLVGILTILLHFGTIKAGNSTQHENCRQNFSSSIGSVGEGDFMSSNCSKHEIQISADEPLLLKCQDLVLVVESVEYCMSIGLKEKKKNKRPRKPRVLNGERDDDDDDDDQRPSGRNCGTDMNSAKKMKRMKKRLEKMEAKLTQLIEMGKDKKAARITRRIEKIKAKLEDMMESQNKTDAEPKMNGSGGNEKKQRKLEKLMDKKERIENRMERLNMKRNRLQGQPDKEAQLAKIEAAISKLEGKSAKLQGKIDRLQTVLGVTDDTNSEGEGEETPNGNVLEQEPRKSKGPNNGGKGKPGGKGEGKDKDKVKGKGKGKGKGKERKKVICGSQDPDEMIDMLSVEAELGKVHLSVWPKGKRNNASNGKPSKPRLRRAKPNSGKGDKKIPSEVKYQCSWSPMTR